MIESISTLLYGRQAAVIYQTMTKARKHYCNNEKHPEDTLCLTVWVCVFVYAIIMFAYVKPCFLNLISADALKQLQ